VNKASIDYQDKAIWALLSLFGFAGLLSTALLYVTLVIFLMLAIFNYRHLVAALSGEALLYSLGALLIYFTAQTYWITQQLPDIADQQWRQFSSLMVLSGLLSIAIGFWLRGDNKRIRAILSLALIGSLIFVLSSVDWSYLNDYLSGTRLISSRSPNALGLLSAAIFLGLIETMRLVWVRSGLWTRLLLILTQLIVLMVLLISQSRSVWIGFVVVMIMFCYRNKGFFRILLLNNKSLIVTACIFLFAATYLAGPIVIERMAQSGMDSLSISHRLDIWKLGVSAFMERPILGWGSGSVEFLMKSLPYPAAKSFPHFHDLYLHIAVTLGGVGLTLLALTYGFLFKKMVKLHALGQVPDDIYQVVISITLLFLIVGLFQVRHDEVIGKYLIVLISAIPASYYFKRAGH
jgi:O-antigen ligase